MNSNYIKTILMEYYRFKRGFDFCCTEGLNYADFLALNEDQLIEIEVKISKSDLKAEFNPNTKSDIKRAKHFEKYCNAQEYVQKRLEAQKRCIGDEKYLYMDTPNKFYICVPENLAEFAIEECRKVNKKYGVIAVLPGGDLWFCQSARKLHNFEPTFKTFKYVGMRTTSELTTLRQKALQEERRNLPIMAEIEKGA